MAGASLEIMAASRPCLQTLQSQNYGKNKFRIQEKLKKLAKLQSERYSGSSTHLLLEASEAGNLSIREGVGKTSL